MSDEEIVSGLEEMDVDINDDNALLKIARNRAEIRRWEKHGWEDGEILWLNLLASITDTPTL